MMIEDSIIKIIISGLLLGAGAGITPGPLNTLILSESLKNGKYAGIKIGIAPLITDTPIIILSLLVVIEISKLDHLLGIITMSGGLYILYLGYKDLSVSVAELDGSTSRENALRKGIITNFLTPHPYVFWLTIGAPMLVEAGRISTVAAILFIVSFYSLLVGFKTALALFTGKMKDFIRNEYYRIIVRVLGVILILFGVYLCYDGFTKLFST